MKLRNIIALSFFGLASSCMNPSQSPLDEISLPQTRYDSPLISIADSGSLFDEEKASKTRMAGNYLLSGINKEGVINYQTDTITDKHLVNIDWIDSDGKTGGETKQIGQSLVRSVKSCIVLNQKSYEFYLSNTHETERWGNGNEKDILTISFFDGPNCDRMYLTLGDNGLDGRVNYLDFPEFKPRESREIRFLINGLKIIQSEPEGSHGSWVTLLERNRPRVQKMYDEAIGGLLTFYRKTK